MQQMKAEIAAGTQLRMCTFLADLRRFFDSIDLHDLASKALELSFPPLLLHHLLCVRSSPRILVAEELCWQPITPVQGVVAGCPMATSVVEVFLWDIAQELGSRRLPRSITTWVDDLGGDVVERRSKPAARRMAACYMAYSEAVRRYKSQVSQEVHGSIRFVSVRAKGISERFGSKFKGGWVLHGSRFLAFLVLAVLSAVVGGGPLARATPATPLQPPSSSHPPPASSWSVLHLDSLRVISLKLFRARCAVISKSVKQGVILACSKNFSLNVPIRTGSSSMLKFEVRIFHLKSICSDHRNSM